MTKLTIPSGGDQFLVALAEYAEAAQGAYAEATARAVAADTKKFGDWCSAQGLRPLPAESRTLALFITAMGERYKPASVRRYVASVSMMHRAAGAQNPAVSQQVKLALKRLHREKGRAQKQAAPLNRPAVERMVSVPGQTLKDKRDKALVALCYDTMMRESEAVALTIDCLELGSDGSGSVLIKRSKTDQEGQGMRRYVHSDTGELLRAWLEAAGHTDGPLFRSVRKGSRLGEALAGPDVARILRTMAERAGVSAQGISGHSCRVGACQDMIGAGVDLIGVMQSGGWASAAMPARYSAKLQARRSGAARLAAMQGR